MGETTICFLPRLLSNLVQVFSDFSINLPRNRLDELYVAWVFTDQLFACFLHVLAIGMIELQTEPNSGLLAQVIRVNPHHVLKKHVPVSLLHVIILFLF